MKEDMGKRGKGALNMAEVSQLKNTSAYLQAAVFTALLQEDVCGTWQTNVKCICGKHLHLLPENRPGRTETCFYCSFEGGGGREPLLTMPAPGRSCPMQGYVATGPREKGPAYFSGAMVTDTS